MHITKREKKRKNEEIQQQIESYSNSWRFFLLFIFQKANFLHIESAHAAIYLDMEEQKQWKKNKNHRQDEIFIY